MKTIVLEELDAQTSDWLRELSRHDQVVITDHGQPLVTITPAPATPAAGEGYQNRVLLPGFEALMNQPLGGTSIDDIIAQDRDDRS